MQRDAAGFSSEAMPMHISVCEGQNCISMHGHAVHASTTPEAHLTEFLEYGWCLRAGAGPSQYPSMRSCLEQTNLIGDTHRIAVRFHVADNAESLLQLVLIVLSGRDAAKLPRREVIRVERLGERGKVVVKALACWTRCERKKETSLEPGG